MILCKELEHQTAQRYLPVSLPEWPAVKGEAEDDAHTNLPAVPEETPEEES